MIVILVPTLLLYQDCKSSPYFIVHIIFIILQCSLIVTSLFYYKRKHGSKQSPEKSGSLLANQSRCCREIISQMKLIDTYTNLCFFSLVVNERESLPMYLVGITMASVIMTVVLKAGLIGYFAIFIMVRLKSGPDEQNIAQDLPQLKQSITERTLIQKTLAKVLIWLDLDTVAKLYDPHTESGESSLYKYHKTRSSYLKTLIEDGPLTAMQALYLAHPYCDEGLNPILIVSLYFNCVCILYSVSNLCGSRSRDGLDDKAYQKEMDRLHSYYDNNRARVIAEFYIEDSKEIQNMKMKALYEYLGTHEFDVQSFNFSSNQMSEETVNFLHEIIVNSSESLEDLALSRCRLKSNHLSYFYFPKGLVSLNLSENRIGDQGAKLIANYILEKNQDSLLALNLQHNLLTEAGAQNLFKAIAQSSVINLNLSRNTIGANQPLSLIMLLDFLRVLQANFIRYFIKVKNQGLTTKLKEEFSLRISSNENIDKILIQLYKIDTMPTLKNLDVSMRFYRNLRQQKTNKQDDKVPKGIQYYDDEQKLILLAIHYNFNLMRVLPKSLWQELQKVVENYYLGNSVSMINLSSNWLSSKAQAIISSCLESSKSLKELVYNNNYTKNSQKFFNAISQCKTLECLQLKSCSFYGFYDVEFKDCFSQLPVLKSLNFNYSALNDSTVISLADCLPFLKSLEKLNLKQIMVSHASVDQILEQLASSQSIKTLNLSQNDLQGLTNLGKFLKQCRKIERIKLSKSQIGDNELKQISYGLKINKSLRMLDLSQNKIQGISEIRDGLSCNVALEQLDLSHNIINDEGLTNLSKALINNGCLETLSISFNSYSLSGLREFLSIFAENESLRNVSFSLPDSIKDHEIFELQDLLKITLTTIKVPFRRLEILGSVDSLDKQDFFLPFILEGAANVEELILDSILSQKQLQDIGRALKQVIEIPLHQEDADRFNRHRLRSITFIKPQEYNEEIQALENLLQEKQTLFFLPQTIQQRIAQRRKVEEEVKIIQVVMEQQLNTNQRQQNKEETEEVESRKDDPKEEEVKPNEIQVEEQKEEEEKKSFGEDEDSIMEDIASQFSDGIQSNMPGDAAPNMGRNFKRNDDYSPDNRV